MTEYGTSASDVLARADALMRRPRIFLAQSKASECDVPREELDVELPILTEVVGEGEISLATTAPSPVIGSNKYAEDQARTIEAELAAWLDRELPKIILRITDALADRLIEELGAEARAHLLASLTRHSGTKPEDVQGN